MLDNNAAGFFGKNVDYYGVLCLIYAHHEFLYYALV